MNRLVNVLGSDQWSEDVVPTVAFNLRQVRKGNVTMKVWDVAVCRPFISITFVMSSTVLEMRKGLIYRVNRNLEECGIDTVEERMLYCMSPLTEIVYKLTNRYVVDAADVSFRHHSEITAQADSTD
jgi:hypothetical protein